MEKNIIELYPLALEFELNFSSFALNLVFFSIHWFLDECENWYLPRGFRKQRCFSKSNESPIMDIHSELFGGNYFKKMRERENEQMRYVFFFFPCWLPTFRKPTERQTLEIQLAFKMLNIYVIGPFITNYFCCSQLLLLAYFLWLKSWESSFP